MAKKGQKLVSAIDGTIIRVNYPQPSWGWSIAIRDSAGYTYEYLHMNDDHPRTNDGKGGAMHAYAADMRVGNRIVKGQFMGWLGDSGYANGISHLHFEMYAPNGTVLNPYPTLKSAKRISAPRGYPQLSNEILPYGTFAGGSSIAIGNFDLDPAEEFVVAAGKGGGPHVKIYDDDNTVIKSIFAYASGFRGGVDVAVGDVDGDGLDDVITGAGPGGGPHVKVFKADGTVLRSFFAHPANVRNGLRVASGDVDGDGKYEVIVGLGAGAQPVVRTFNLSSGSAVLMRTFLAYASGFRGGVDVAAGDTSSASPYSEIVTGAGPGGGPHVKVFQWNGTKLSSFYAFATTMKGGIRVSVGNVIPETASSEILATAASKHIPQVRVYNSAGTNRGYNIFLEQWWIGGYDIAAGVEKTLAITGVNRRVSVREAL